MHFNAKTESRIYSGCLTGNQRKLFCLEFVQIRLDGVAPREEKSNSLQKKTNAFVIIIKAVFSKTCSTGLT